jgi:hypothetical protein
MRRVALLRSLTAVLLIVFLLCAAATWHDSHGLAWIVLAFVSWVPALVSIRIDGGERCFRAQAPDLAARLSPRAPPFA